MSELPGNELVERKIADLRRGDESVEALRVSIGAPRLQQLGYGVAGAFDDPEKRLYARLASENQDSAHSRYNALVRRLVSFERAAECVSQQTRSESRAYYGRSGAKPRNK